MPTTAAPPRNIARNPPPQNPKKSTANFRIRGTLRVPRGFARRSPLIQTLPLLFFVLILCAAPLRAHSDITSGLVGYWSFDEGTGTKATDFSGNGNTGTLKKTA